MTEREYFLKFVNKRRYGLNDIENLKKTLSLNDNQLIRKAFKLLYSEIDYLKISTDYIYMINNCTNLLFNLCAYTHFDDDNIIINRRRVKKGREALLKQAELLKNEQLLKAANRLDEIILGKSLELKDLNRLLKKLISKKEDINIIKKILGTNKGVLAFENNELFDFVFDQSLIALADNSADIYYYIALLKIFYNSTIDKNRYLRKLTHINEETNEFETEIYYIIHGQRRPLDKNQVLDKYGIITNLQTINTLPVYFKTSEEMVFTIDSDGAIVKDDALSIKEKNNNYIVGIHISDPTDTIKPDSIIDFQAKNNFTCSYMPEYKTQILPSNLEQDFSLDKGNLRKVLSMYVTIDKEGNIIDYTLKENYIKIDENLYYSQSDKLLSNVNDEISFKLSQLYNLAGQLQYKNAKKYLYWYKKENDSLDKEIVPFRSDKIINELMVLYNNLIATIACENGIPYVYRTQNNAYLENLIKKLEIPLDKETDKIIKNIYLKSKYSSVPIYHNGLNLQMYSHSTSALRRYPDLYNQFLLHSFYFKDMDMEFDNKYHEKLIDYFNQRSIEIDLMKAEYTRALKPKED